MTLDNENLLKYSKKYVDPFKNHKETTFPQDTSIKALDHIFLDQRLTYSDEIIYSNSNDNGFMSDHNPISCIVKINM
jgi:endonuclease/exonuclease/phosphatase family metal-dependent hydrolase